MIFDKKISGPWWALSGPTTGLRGPEGPTGLRQGPFAKKKKWRSDLFFTYRPFPATSRILKFQKFAKFRHF